MDFSSGVKWKEKTTTSYSRLQARKRRMLHFTSGFWWMPELSLHPNTPRTEIAQQRWGWGTAGPKDTTAPPARAQALKQTGPHSRNLSLFSFKTPLGHQLHPWMQFSLQMTTPKNLLTTMPLPDTAGSPIPSLDAFQSLQKTKYFNPTISSPQCPCKTPLGAQFHPWIQFRVSKRQNISAPQPFHPSVPSSTFFSPSAFTQLRNPHGAAAPETFLPWPGPPGGLNRAVGQGWKAGVSLKGFLYNRNPSLCQQGSLHQTLPKMFCWQQKKANKTAWKFAAFPINILITLFLKCCVLKVLFLVMARSFF